MRQRRKRWSHVLGYHICENLNFVCKLVYGSDWNVGILLPSFA
jgi:hypothetical protein